MFDNSFLGYLQLLELMAFFSGFPLVYSIALFVSGKISASNPKLDLRRLLPYAYALVGTLYLGYLLKNLYPDYSIANIKNSFQHPFLVTWALLSLLFWIPAINKRPILSLLHSLVFFFFLLRDLYIQITDTAADKNILSNDMKIYTTSLMINFCALIFILLIYLMYRLLTKKKSHLQHK